MYGIMVECQVRGFENRILRKSLPSSKKLGVTF